MTVRSQSKRQEAAQTTPKERRRKGALIMQQMLCKLIDSLASPLHVFLRSTAVSCHLSQAPRSQRLSEKRGQCARAGEKSADESATANPRRRDAQLTPDATVAPTLSTLNIPQSLPP
ncbi:unnamed protein product [Lota lota]